MIVSQLYGGLGNQLFQYAVGRALAARRETCLRLDMAKLNTYPLRTYKLTRFAVTATPLSAAERKAYRIPTESTNRFQRLVRRLIDGPKIPVVREKGFGFDPSVLEAPAHCYLEGYWQSPKYFDFIENVIRAEFRFGEPLSGHNAAIGNEISRTGSVAVHVRRGDYVSNPTTSSYHGTCSIDYYLEAEKRLRGECGELVLFVFSDDPDWTQANLRFQSRTLIMRQNGLDEDHLDLQLMTLCKHHIIANSTFSWWGAWLCEQPGKCVIAPKQWFRDPNQPTDDLIPTNWLRL